MCNVLPSFCFYSAHIASLIGHVVRNTPSSTDNLNSTKTQKSDKPLEQRVQSQACLSYAEM